MCGWPFSSRWIEELKSITPYDTSDYSLTVHDAQEFAKNVLQKSNEDALVAKENSKKRDSVSLGVVELWKGFSPEEKGAAGAGAMGAGDMNIGSVSSRGRRKSVMALIKPIEPVAPELEELEELEESKEPSWRDWRIY